MVFSSTLEPPVAADPTLDFAKRFNDPKLWQIMPGVPVFDSHVEQDDESGELLKFGPEELDELVKNTNRMVALGKPPGLILGHTDDNLPEDKQPVPIGFAKNFRVQRFGPEQKLGILQDEWYFPGQLAVAKTYPFRSVERWRKGRYFSPIALLRREPRRPLGIVGYSQDADDCVIVHSRHVGGDSVVRYSSRYSAMAEPTPPPSPNPESQAPPTRPQPAAAAMPQEPMEPSDKDKQLFSKLAMSHPHLGPMIQKYMKESGAAVEPPTGQEMPAAAPPPGESQSESAKNAACMPSGTNGEIPNMKKAEHNRARPDVARYQALEQEVASLKRESRMARYSKALSDLRTKEGVQFDEAEELVEVQDMDQAAFQKHVKKMRTNYRKEPIGDGPIRLADDTNPSQRDGGRVNDKATMEKVLKYQQQNPGVSWEKARDAVVKGG
jgi:hypothetical protein